MWIGRILTAILPTSSTDTGSTQSPDDSIVETHDLGLEQPLEESVPGTRAKEKRSGLCSKLSFLFVAAYSERLKSHPICTKAFTAGIMNVVGDLLAQGIGRALDESSGLDNRRVIAMFIEGLCFAGPVMHFAYEKYEYYFPILRCDSTEPIDKHDTPVRVANVKTVWKNVLVHVTLDQIFMMIFYVFGLMTITSVVEGHASHVAAELQNDYFHNLQASWSAALFFGPMQVFAFAKLSKEFRVLATNVIDILWVAVMSIVTHLHRDQSKSVINAVLNGLLLTAGVVGACSLLRPAKKRLRYSLKAYGKGFINHNQYLTAHQRIDDHPQVQQRRKYLVV